MSSEETVKKAFELAEKEVQEIEVSKIKKIVQSYLQDIEELVEKKKDVEEKIKVLKSELDDLKDGRIDKIKERHEKDEKARNIFIIIVKCIEQEYLPLQPWRSPWIIQLKNDINNGFVFMGANGAITTTGNTFANFTGGTYTVTNTNSGSTKTIYLR